MNNNILSRIKTIFSIFLLTIVISTAYLFIYNLFEPRVYNFLTSNVLVKKLPFDHNKRVYGSDDIVLIMIDAKSVEKYRWPWRRDLYCGILNYFSQYTKAKVLISDTIMTSMDKDNQEADKKYLETLKNTDKVITGVLLNPQKWQNVEEGVKYDEKFSKKFSVPVKELDYIPDIVFNSVIKFPMPFFYAVKHIGVVNIIPGAISGNDLFTDEVCRNATYFYKYKGYYYPSIAMRAFLLLNNPKEITISKDKITFPDLNYTISQKRSFLKTCTPIKFYKLIEETPYSHKVYSAIDIIESYELLKKGKAPIIEPSVFKDKIIVFGANVPASAGLNDNKQSPLSYNHPGADIQATVIDNLFHNDFLYVLPQLYNLLITLLGMLLVYLAAKHFDINKSVAAVLIILIGYSAVGICCFYNDIIINIITPLAMFIVATIFAYTCKYIAENKNKEKVQNAMGKYMSKDVMQMVIKNIDNLGLSGKRAVVTVLFSDIRGFTSMSEKMPAQQVSEFLNEYFSEMEPIITSYNGIINKFIGDAIMAVFGEPIQDENHAQNAVKCAYAMLKRVEQLRNKWDMEGKPEIEIGIGINTGEVFVGNIGSINRMEYTVIGDTVNLASRLEGYNKMYKTRMLISAETYKSVRQIADVIKIPEVQIRGKANKIDIYEVLKVKID